MTKAKVYHDGAVSGARRIVDMALTIFLCLLCIVWIYPVLLILLNSLKAELARPAARAGGLRPLELTMEIAKGYNAFNNDSALLYYSRGYDAARALA